MRLTLRQQRIPSLRQRAHFTRHYKAEHGLVEVDENNVDASLAHRLVATKRSEDRGDDIKVTKNFEEARRPPGAAQASDRD